MMVTRSGRLDTVCPFFHPEDAVEVQKVGGAKAAFQRYCTATKRTSEECDLIEHDAFHAFTHDEQEFDPDDTICAMLDKLNEAVDEEALTDTHGDSLLKGRTNIMDGQEKLEKSLARKGTPRRRIGTSYQGGYHGTEPERRRRG